jgi:hypothetical protein
MADNNLKRQKIIKNIYHAGIKKSKNIEDKGQKYDMLNDDLHINITNINSHFDFKSFNKETLKEVEIVRNKFIFIIYSFLMI